MRKYWRPFPCSNCHVLPITTTLHSWSVRLELMSVMLLLCIPIYSFPFILCRCTEMCFLSWFHVMKFLIYEFYYFPKRLPIVIGYYFFSFLYSSCQSLYCHDKKGQSFIQWFCTVYSETVEGIIHFCYEWFAFQAYLSLPLFLNFFPFLYYHLLLCLMPLVVFLNKISV